MNVVQCSTCQVEIPEAELLNGWCEGCGTKIPPYLLSEAGLKDPDLNPRAQQPFPDEDDDGGGDVLDPVDRYPPKRPPVTIPAPCPCCEKISGSIKCFTFTDWFFIVIGMAAQKRREIACPGCMRGKIMTHSIVQLLTANLLWPIVILPHCVVLLMRTFSKGHSKEVQEALR